MLIDARPNGYRRLRWRRIATVADVVAMAREISIHDGVIPDVVTPGVRVIPGDDSDQLGLTDED
jgi:hypothetical protein